MFENQGNSITREQYGNGYMLFVFDLAPDPCLGDHKQPMKTGNPLIECQFGTPLESAINFEVIGEFIEIDANQNDICDFNNQI